MKVKKHKLHAIGLMSGTSLDGLDLCYSSFWKDEESNWQFEILKTQTISYSKEWKEKLNGAIHLSSENLWALHSEYGFYLGEQVKNFIHKHLISKIDIIASHGHTVFHQPHRKFTFQIGDGRAIKIINQIPVVYDFRSQDVLMGGNGAPLVPIGDEYLFSQYDSCLNLGGFSNISLNHNGERIAFDICPVNIVMNYFAEKLGKSYDEQGNFAAEGNIHETVLKQMNELDFYKVIGPKSLGREWVNLEILPLLESLPSEDALATISEHAQLKIAKTLDYYNIKKVMITGGGAKNIHLIQNLRQKTSAEIVIPNEEIIDYKEALIFAFLGILRLKNENNVLASATGSTENHCSGILV